MTGETLLPCPFCGEDEATEHKDERDDRHYGVSCVACGAELTGYERLEDAIADWQRRALAPALDRVIAEVEGMPEFVRDEKGVEDYVIYTPELAAMLRIIRAQTKGE